MLMDEVIPQLLQYLRANPGCPELNDYDHLLIDEYQDLTIQIEQLKQEVEKMDRIAGEGKESSSAPIREEVG